MPREILDGYRSLNTSAHAIKGYMNRFDDHSQNLSRVGAISGKRQETYLSVYKGLHASDSGKLDGYRWNHLSEIGAPIPSRTSTHLSIACCSYFIVKDNETQNLGYTKIGTFDWDKDKKLVNHLNQKLQVIIRDPSTKTISDNISNLEDLSVDNLVYDPEATSNIGVKLQLAGNAELGANFEERMAVYDSLGNDQFLTFHWTRVPVPNNANPDTTQAWKLTVTGDDTTQVESSVDSPYGNQTYGMVMEFDGLGKPTAYRSWDGATGYSNALSTPPNLKVDWNNASLNSDIALNLGNLGSDQGVVSLGSIYNEYRLNRDGIHKGDFHELKFDKNGYGTIAYTNGKVEKYCRIPLAHCNSVDNLSMREDGIFYPNTKSGPMEYIYPNTKNIGILVPSALEGSTIDATQVNVEMVEDQQRFANNLAAFKTTSETMARLNDIIV